MPHPLPSVVLFSCAESSFKAASQEIRDAFQGASIERLGPDLGAASHLDVPIAAVAATCLRRPLIFVRHLALEKRRLDGRDADHLQRATEAACDAVAAAEINGELAVQTWQSGEQKAALRGGALVESLAARLRRQGIALVRGGANHVLSLCRSKAGLSIGLNARQDSLADWPGGRIRLARDDSQISRAEFKLEEAFRLFSIEWPQEGRALDLGASPGGWTRILRRRGFRVWAVDPGGLDPRIAADPDVHAFSMTAGKFLASDPEPFDLAVNDMKMEPHLSCRLMLDAAPALQPGAPIVLTLKTGARTTAQEIGRCLDMLRQRYVITHARQLYHNRREITVAARRIA